MTSIPFNKETGQPIDNRRASYKSSENHPNAKLTQIQVDEIRELVKQGALASDLAVRFKVGKTTINSIVSGKSWKIKDETI